MRFKLGCDPEIFCLNEEGQYKSAIGTFGGSKEMPLKLEALGKDFAVQEDNVALEFNIPPSESSEAFIKNVNVVMDYLIVIAKDAFGLMFSTESGVIFPKEELMDPRAMEFGCDPDYNAWNGKMNPRPTSDDPGLRSAGGHVHIGIEEKLNQKEKCRLGRLMDLHLGVPSVVMDNGVVRKKLYGKAGAVRFKPYGLEYRTLSNFWVFSKVLNKWVWDSTERALDDFQKGRDVLDLEAIITSTINDNNTMAASSMIAEHSLLMV